MTRERLAVFRARFLGVGVNVSVNALHERVREAFFDGAFAPFFLDFFVGRGCAGAGGFEFFAESHEPFRRVGTAIQQNVFDQFLQLRLDLLVNFQHAGVDDAHVHAGFDGVIEKRAVHRLAHGIVAAKTKRHVRHAAADFRVRQIFFDPARGFDEIHGVVIVLLDARADGEDVRIENNVLRRKADFVHQNLIGAFADADLVRERRGLALFVKRHDDHGCAVFQNFRACSRNFASPSFIEMEFTMPLP